MSFAVRTTESFSGASLAVDFVLRGTGTELTGRTDREPIQVPAGTYSLHVGMDANSVRSSLAVVPSVFERVDVRVATEVAVDLASASRLFDGPTLRPGIEPKHLIETYRGRGNLGRNQVWRSQPRRYIVSDPFGRLSAFPDAKANAEFDYILRAFAAVNDYTNGYLRVPSQDEIEITSADRSYTSYGAGEFVIRVASGGLESERLVGDEIVASWVQGNTNIPGALTLQSEMVSAVQGGDSESEPYGGHGMRNGPVNAIDRTWGLLNYWKRKPGDRMLPSGDITPSPYEFPVEFRTL